MPKFCDNLCAGSSELACFERQTDVPRRVACEIAASEPESPLYCLGVVVRDHSNERDLCVPRSAWRTRSISFIPLNLAHETVQKGKHPPCLTGRGDSATLKDKSNPVAEVSERAGQGYLAAVAGVVVPSRKSEKNCHKHFRLGGVRTQDRAVGSPTGRRPQHFEKR
ncbi:MAG: hypothetical protein F4020_10420 [Gammaproteobacteria bacterium]|nr:hypothetical protein [Acidobacteriota bacterium]MYK69887.1 hypothetical protein [Gammaproteobacteria bacterium]